MHLEKLSLWAAIATLQVDLNFSLRYLIICLLIIILAIAPGALWTCVLTPVNVPTELLVSTINVPRFTKNPAKVWNSEFKVYEANLQLWNMINKCQQIIQDEREFFPTFSVRALQPFLLLSARTVTIAGGAFLSTIGATVSYNAIF